MKDSQFASVFVFVTLTCGYVMHFVVSLTEVSEFLLVLISGAMFFVLMGWLTSKLERNRKSK